MKLITLIYHDVLVDAQSDDSGFSGEDAASYKLTVAAFDRHLAMIAKHAATSPLRIGALNDLSEASAGLILSFDDGGASGTSRVAARLESRAWPGHFFVTSNFIGQKGFMSATDLRRLHAAGHVVGSHSASHPTRISRLPQAQILAEWNDSCARIADILGSAVHSASVPGGFYSRAVAETARDAGISVLFTSEPTSAVSNVEGIAVVGRFSVTRRTSDKEIVALTEARAAILARHQLLWGAKKIVKRVGGRAWIAVRKRLFELGVG